MKLEIVRAYVACDAFDLIFALLNIAHNVALANFAVWRSTPDGSGTGTFKIEVSQSEVYPSEWGPGFGRTTKEAGPPADPEVLKDELRDALARFMNERFASRARAEAAAVANA